MRLCVLENEAIMNRKYVCTKKTKVEIFDVGSICTAQRNDLLSARQTNIDIHPHIQCPVPQPQLSVSSVRGQPQLDLIFFS